MGTTRTLATGLIALVLAWGLAGCSASGGATTGGVAEGADSVMSEQEVPATGETDRSVVIEGTMSLAVSDVSTATQDATRIVRDAGGRIDGRDEWTEGEGEHAQSHVTLVLRIPATALDGAISQLRALGDVETLDTSTIDVTSSVRDLDARIAALRSTLARLESFQAQATSVDDLLAIEKEINGRQGELERNLADQAALAERTELSTITLSLRSVQKVAAPPPDTFLTGLGVGWASFGAFLAGLAVVLGVLLPWLLAAGVVTAAIVLIVRAIKRRRPSAGPPPPPGPLVPPYAAPPPA